MESKPERDSDRSAFPKKPDEVQPNFALPKPDPALRDYSDGYGSGSEKFGKE